MTGIEWVCNEREKLFCDGVEVVSVPLKLLRSITVAFSLLLAAAAIWPALAQEAEPPLSEPYFRVSEYAGRTLFYSMVTTGSLSIDATSEESHGVSFDLRIGLGVTFETPDQEGNLPFTITLNQVEARGLEEQLGASLDGRGVRGVLGPSGAIRTIETPPLLADLGLDLTDLLLGLAVPAPQDEDGERPAWTASFSRSNFGPDRARSLNLTATYTAQGPKQWGNRTLSSVTARLRGSTSVREGTVRTSIQEIGHALFYLEPETGVVEMSSISIVTLIDTSRSGDDDVQTKITLTTTLELDRSKSTSAAAPEREATAPKETVQPVESADAEPAADPEPADEPSRTDPATQAPEEQLKDAAGQSADSPEEQDASDPEVQDALPGPSPSETSDASSEEPDVRSPEPSRPAQRVLYQDPAGRFLIRLPGDWAARPVDISLRGTTFRRSQPDLRVYVYFMPLPSPSASALNVAKSALTTYQETQPGFRVLEEPVEDHLDGEIAYRAFYRYTADEGQTVSEWGLFARKLDRAVYVQVAAAGALAPEEILPILVDIRDHFRFGPNPRGSVPVEELEQSLERYEDPRGRFTLTIPGLWPRTDLAEDGATTTFTEIGENAFLTIFAQTGARGIPASQIVASWQEQWAKEDGFELLQEVTSYPLSGHDGVRLDYRWSGVNGSSWTRRLHAAVVEDSLFALALDYQGSVTSKRAAFFDAIVESFEILDAASAPDAGGDAAPADDRPEGPSQKPDQAGDQTPVPGDDQTPGQRPAQEPEQEPSQSAASETAQASEGSAGDRTASERSAFPAPESEESVLLLGRILTRYLGPDDEMIDEWAANVELVVDANDREISTTTDDLGYVQMPNLPPLDGGRLYTVVRLRGPMFGFDQAVTVSFDNLEVGEFVPRVAYLRHLVLTLNPDRTLDVEIVEEPPMGTDDLSPLQRFMVQHPESPWTEFVREATMTSRE